MTDIVVSREQPQCVRWAAGHVRADLKRLGAGLARIIVGTGHPAVQKVLAKHPSVPEFEGFVIDRDGTDGSTVVVAAHDFRGSMFGLLEISRRLGVDPLEFFSDASAAAAVGRLSLPIHSPPPAFRYRGFFVAQEDLLTSWQKADGPVPLRIYDEIFLAILRLGGNMVLPATFIAADSPILDLAVRRGLMLAQHHFQVVGTDVHRLAPRQKAKYSFFRFPEATAEIWRRAIRANRHRPTLWTVGYRGSNDNPFWHEESATFCDRRKGKMISDAIRTQYGLLQEELGTVDVPCFYYIYRENQVLYQKGYIRVPDGVNVVWCDNGYGTMETYFRDGYEMNWSGDGDQKVPVPAKGRFAPAWPRAKRKGGGIYYHVSFLDSSAPNREQYVSPVRIQQNFVRAQRKGLDGMLLLNVGNIREFVLGIDAAFDFARDARPWLADKQHHRKYLRTWCAGRFGRKLASRVADVYEMLYDSHWWWGTSPGKCFGDNGVRFLMQDVIHRFLGSPKGTWMSEYHMPEMTAAERVEMILTDGRASMDRWQKALTAAERVGKSLPPTSRTFFFENVIVQARRGLGAIKTLVLAADAVAALERHDAQACLGGLAEAKRALDAWRGALDAANRGSKWRNWTRGDRIVLPGAADEYLTALTSLAKAKINCEAANSDSHVANATRQAEKSASHAKRR